MEIKAKAAVFVLVFGLSLLVNNAFGAAGVHKALEEDAKSGQKNDMIESTGSEDYSSQDIVNEDNDSGPIKTPTRTLEKIKSFHENEPEKFHSLMKHSDSIQKKNVSSTVLNQEKKPFRQRNRHASRHRGQHAEGDRESPYSLEDLRKIKFASDEEEAESDEDDAISNSQTINLSLTKKNNTGHESVPPSPMRMTYLSKKGKIASPKHRGKVNLDSMEEDVVEDSSSSYPTNYRKGSMIDEDPMLGSLQDEGKTPLQKHHRTKPFTKKVNKHKKKLSSQKQSIGVNNMYGAQMNRPWNSTLNTSSVREDSMKFESYSRAGNLKFGLHGILSTTSILVAFVSRYGPIWPY